MIYSPESSRFVRAAFDDFQQHLLNEVIVLVGERVGLCAGYVVVKSSAMVS